MQYEIMSQIGVFLILDDFENVFFQISVVDNAIWFKKRNEEVRTSAFTVSSLFIYRYDQINKLDTSFLYF